MVKLSQTLLLVGPSVSILTPNGLLSWNRSTTYVLISRNPLDHNFAPSKMCELLFIVCGQHQRIEVTRVVYCRAVQSHPLTTRSGRDVAMFDDCSFVWNENFCRTPRVAIYNKITSWDCEGRRLVTRSWGEETANGMQLDMDPHPTEDDVKDHDGHPLVLSNSLPVIVGVFPQAITPMQRVKTPPAPASINGVLAGEASANGPDANWSTAVRRNAPQPGLGVIEWTPTPGRNLFPHRREEIENVAVAHLNAEEPIHGNGANGVNGFSHTNGVNGEWDPRVDEEWDV